MVWRWQERFMNEGVAGVDARQDSALAYPAVAGRDRERRRRLTNRATAARGDPLDRPSDGQGVGDQPVFGAADLDRARAAAAPGASIQDCPTILMRRQAQGCRRPLRRSAGPCVVLSIDEKSRSRRSTALGPRARWRPTRRTTSGTRMQHPMTLTAVRRGRQTLEASHSRRPILWAWKEKPVNKCPSRN